MFGDYLKFAPILATFIIIVEFRLIMKLKQLPEDFVVREIMELDLKPKGDHGYFIMKKRN